MPWQTLAKRSKVHRLVGWPNRRGLWCNKSLSGSAKRWSRNGRAECGLEDFCLRQSRPSRAKAWRAWWTVGVEQPKWWAICAGVWPAAECSRIWQRRTVKAAGLRRPLRKRR